jgi:hypothetical protein
MDILLVPREDFNGLKVPRKRSDKRSHAFQLNLEKIVLYKDGVFGYEGNFYTPAGYLTMCVPQNELRPCNEPSLKIASFNLLKKKYDKNNPERKESDESEASLESDKVSDEVEESEEET